MGWVIGNGQNSSLVVNALDLAIKTMSRTGGIVHADHGVRLTSWVLMRWIRAADLKLSIGIIGSGYDNAIMESLWSSRQKELLNRKKWRTQFDRPKATFAYIELLQPSMASLATELRIPGHTRVTLQTIINPRLIFKPCGVKELWGRSESQGKSDSSLKWQVKMAWKPALMPLVC